MVPPPVSRRSIVAVPSLRNSTLNSRACASRAVVSQQKLVAIPPDQNGVNPASTQDRFELRCLETAKMRLRQNDVAGLDDDFGMKCGRWCPVVDHALCHWRHRLSQDAHI